MRFSMSVFALSLMLLSSTSQVITEDGLSILQQIEGAKDFSLSDENKLIYSFRSHSCCDSEKEEAQDP